jgi:hypothetical protein
LALSGGAVVKSFAGVLIALARLRTRHTFAFCAIGSFASTLSNFIFCVIVWFANAAWPLARFLCSRQRHAIRIARKFAISSMVLFAFRRRIHRLAKAFHRQPEKQEQTKDQNFFHSGISLVNATSCDFLWKNKNLWRPAGYPLYSSPDAHIQRACYRGAGCAAIPGRLFYKLIYYHRHCVSNGSTLSQLNNAAPLGNVIKLRQRM